MNSTAIYLRVSTDRQSKGLEAQELAVQSYINQSSNNDYVTYKDEGISGAKASRPALNQLMEAARSGKHKTVVVYSFSRFARSTKHLLEALEEFDQLGVKFISLTEKLDTGSPMGRAVFVIISAIAQLERELISERVKSGLVNAKSKGKKLGRPKLTNEALIKQLSQQGLTYEKIAELAGCSPSSVCRTLKSSKNPDG